MSKVKALKSGAAEWWAEKRESRGGGGKERTGREWRGEDFCKYIRFEPPRAKKGFWVQNDDAIDEWSNGKSAQIETTDEETK